MPLTPSGKADRRALARMAPAGPAALASPATPSTLTPVQEIVAGIWRDVLGLGGPPGAEAHFFELGGHSLLATQVISRVRQALGVDVPLRGLFEAPTVAGLAGMVERALRAGAGLAVPPLVPQPRDGALPLSFAQERLWFVHRLLPASSHYNMPSAIRLEGALDPALLAHALEEIIRRHEVLRTSFPALAGIPVQRIAPPGRFEPALVDLGGLPPERRLPEARHLAADDARRPFDLTGGTALRATLVRLDQEDHAGIFTLHHIVSDGWSRGVFLHELTAIYGAFREGRPSPLPPLAVQYADFAVWQRGWLRDEALEAQLSYWRRQLESVPPLEMPLDRPRPTVQRFRAGRVAIHLPPALAESLRQLAGSQGVTLYMALLAGFEALVHRYTGQEDFALGSPIANRNRAEIEGLIGFFVNSLVLRVRLDGDPTFRELLARVREVSLQAYAHQDLPFEKLVEELQPERSLSRNPLFQVVLALQNAPVGTLELPGLTLSPLGPEGGATRFDLEVHLWDLPDGLRGMALYDRDLFDATTIARLVSHLERELSAAVAGPGRPLSELELLTGPERVQLLSEWNDTAVDFGPFAGVCQRFEARVLEAPDALAVAMGGEELSYRELDLPVQPAGAPSARAGRRPGDGGGHLPRALRRSGGGHPGGGQDRRRLPPPGPGLPGAASGLHAAGCRRPGRGRPRAARAGGGRGGAARGEDRCRPGGDRRPRQRRAAGRLAARGSRVRHLHFGLDRPSQGGGPHPRRSGQPGLLAPAVLRRRAAGPGHPAGRARFRRFGRGRSGLI